MLNTRWQRRQVRRPVRRGVERLPDPGQEFRQLVGLRHAARVAVEDEPAGGVGTRQPFAKQGQDDLVRDQLARVHRRLGLEAERRLAGDGIAQQVAGGHLRDAVFLDEALRLRAFP
jgi:hypothetical protein